MQITKPEYYDAFRCIAGRCPDSCCKEWDVQVDDAAAAYYRSLPGELGDRLRQVLTDTEYGTVMTIEDGRCPMWRQDGLCRIQAQLGEGALCQVCRDFPRLTHDYGDFLELGLELSCPEAARLIFAHPNASMVVLQQPGGEEPEYDRDAMEVLKETRTHVLNLLEEASLTPAQRLALVLLYGYEAQAVLDGEEPVEFDPTAALATGESFGSAGTMAEIGEFFGTLEILSDHWRELLTRAGIPHLTSQCIPLARYLIGRYWLQAVSDYDLACRVKFIVVFCLLVSSLPGDFVENAQRCSKEVENNVDNVEALLDAAYSHRAFTDDRILGLLLK